MQLSRAQCHATSGEGTCNERWRCCSSCWRCAIRWEGRWHCRSCFSHFLLLLLFSPFQFYLYATMLQLTFFSPFLLIDCNARKCDKGRGEECRHRNECFSPFPPSNGDEWWQRRWQWWHDDDNTTTDDDNTTTHDNDTWQWWRQYHYSKNEHRQCSNVAI